MYSSEIQNIKLYKKAPTIRGHGLKQFFLFRLSYLLFFSLEINSDNSATDLGPSLMFQEKQPKYNIKGNLWQN